MWITFYYKKIKKNKNKLLIKYKKTQNIVKKRDKN